MKLYSNIDNFNFSWLKNKGEVPLLVSILPRKERKEFLSMCEKEYVKLFEPLLDSSVHTMEDIKRCDYVVLPFKLGIDNHFPFMKQAIENGKKMIMFYNDDASEVINVPLEIG